MAARETRKQSYARLGKIMKFPSEVHFRVIVDASFTDAYNLMVRKVEALDKGSVIVDTPEPRKSRSGRYLSYCLPVKVKSAAMLKRIYETVGALPFVKQIL